MKNKYAGFITLIIIWMLADSCKNPKSDVYIIDSYSCARNFSCNFNVDIGIFGYILKQRNITNIKNDCCFLYPSKDKGKDSIIEMSYKRFSITENLFDTLFRLDQSMNDSVYQPSPRALFIVKMESQRSDTIFMDKNLTVRYKDKTFKASKKLEYLNWIENYPYMSRFNIIK